MCKPVANFRSTLLGSLLINLLLMFSIAGSSAINHVLSGYRHCFLSRFDFGLAAPLLSSSILWYGGAGPAPKQLRSLAITPSNPTLALGSSQQLMATGTFSDGSTQDLTSEVSWKTSVPAVATISNSGLVTTMAPGMTDIAARLNGWRDSTQLTVVRVPAGTVILKPEVACTLIGQSYQFGATVSGTNGGSVNWYVDGVANGSSKLGTITSTGLYIAPASAGTHTIKAVSVDNPSNNSTATVNVITGVKVTLNAATAAVMIGRNQQFSASVCGSSNQAVSWSATGGVITTSGLYTAPSFPGTYAVTATSVADSTKSAGVTITVYSRVAADFGSRAAGIVIPPELFSAQYVERLPSTAVDILKDSGFTGGRTYANIPKVYATTTPNWSAIDSTISKYVNAGISPIIEMAYAPAWLLPSSPCSMNTAPTDINLWAQIAASYVAHFDQKFPRFITEYEIWNEPSHNFCGVTNKLSTYLSLYAAAASAMRNQANADSMVIHIGGPASFGETNWITALLTNSSTAPYVDFISYHQYLYGSAEINLGLNWDSSADAAPLYNLTQDPTTGQSARFKSVVTAAGAGVPVYVTEYNDSATFGGTCCRNSSSFGPLWNTLVVADLLNTAYAGAQTVPSRLNYYAAGSTSSPNYFCLYGTPDIGMDCSTSGGFNPYPQTYAYTLLASPRYLGLKGGGHMATSVSPPTTQLGLVVTAFYTDTLDAIVIVNPTASDYSSVEVLLQNPGIAVSSGTYYLLNETNSTIMTQTVELTSAPDEYFATISVPRYSVGVVSIAQ